jgi:hypothetical protein
MSGSRYPGDDAARAAEETARACVQASGEAVAELAATVAGIRDDGARTCGCGRRIVPCGFTPRCRISGWCHSESGSEAGSHFCDGGGPFGPVARPAGIASQGVTGTPNLAAVGTGPVPQCAECGGRGNVPNIHAASCRRFAIAALAASPPAVQARAELARYDKAVRSPSTAQHAVDALAAQALCTARLRELLAEITRQGGAL